MNGQTLQLSNDNSALSAIDTGTTLVGGPSNAVQAVYQSIPNAVQLTGQMQGFFAFRE